MSGCQLCGFLVEGKRRDARFCSGACKQKAYRDRQERLEAPLRIAQVRVQIERDQRIADEDTRSFYIRATNKVIHLCYGASFPALGRVRKAERYLQRLERLARAVPAVA